MLSADEVSQIESAIASLPRFKGNCRRARLRVCPDFSRSCAAGYPIPRNCGLSSPEMWAVERVAQVAAIVRFLEWNAAVHAPSFTEATHVALVDLARAAMAALKDGLPRAGGGSWQFPKFFGILRLTYFVMEFGPIMFYSTQWCVPSVPTPAVRACCAESSPVPPLQQLRAGPQGREEIQGQGEWVRGYAVPNVAEESGGRRRERVQQVDGRGTQRGPRRPA